MQVSKLESILCMRARARSTVAYVLCFPLVWPAADSFRAILNFLVYCLVAGPNNKEYAARARAIVVACQWFGIDLRPRLPLCMKSEKTAAKQHPELKAAPVDVVDVWLAICYWFCVLFLVAWFLLNGGRGQFFGAYTVGCTLWATGRLLVISR